MKMGTHRWTHNADTNGMSHTYLLYSDGNTHNYTPGGVGAVHITQCIIHNPHHVPCTVIHILHTMCGVHCPTSHHSMVQWTVHRTHHVLS